MPSYVAQSVYAGHLFGVLFGGKHCLGSPNSRGRGIRVPRPSQQHHIDHKALVHRPSGRQILHHINEDAAHVVRVGSEKRVGNFKGFRPSCLRHYEPLHPPTLQQPAEASDETAPSLDDDLGRLHRVVSFESKGHRNYALQRALRTSLIQKV